MNKKVNDSLGGSACLLVGAGVSVRERKHVVGSVTRWLTYLYNIWPFVPNKICQKALNCQKGRF